MNEIIKIEGNYPDGEGKLTHFWNNGKTKFKHITYDDGSWHKFTYNENGKPIHFEDSDGYWIKYEYYENGNEIYFENSLGVIKDNRQQNNN